MPPKQDYKRLTASRVISRQDSLEGGEETEIAAQISLPTEGGWGWVVVFASFVSIMILDGVSFTFGSLMSNIEKDLQISESLAALLNSIAVAMYLLGGPLVSAFINRFGFRACVMTGSAISSTSLLISYFMTNYASLCVFYGFTAGIGFSFINMSCGLVVGFYFEKLRPIALSITSVGSSVGVMTFFPLNTLLISYSSWRSVTLLHSGLCGFIYFLGMTYRPLVSFTVVNTTDDPCRTVTYLPSVAAGLVKATPSRSRTQVLESTKTEKLFSAVSNYNFPTANKVLEENAINPTQPGPSVGKKSRLTLLANNPQGGVSRRQIQQVKSIMSTNVDDDDASQADIDIIIHIEEPKQRSFLARLFQWQPHVPESRPMYRDDAFYDGRLEKLPIYQKSMMDTGTGKKTGLEYQLAVSRAAAAEDLKEQRGVFTTAARRVLATMMDPSLLKKGSFILMACCGLLIYLGYLVPYVYLPARNSEAGLNSQHCSIFISVIGLANAFGRLILGGLSCKVNPVYLFAISSLIAGISTIVSGISYSVYYQYAYCVIFGLFISASSCLRSVCIVELYGLDVLTNATGMMLLFQGIGSLVSTPLAGILKSEFGYDVAFYVAGLFITLSGIILLPVNMLASRENKKAQTKDKTVQTTTNKQSVDTSVPKASVDKKNTKPNKNDDTNNPKSSFPRYKDKKKKKRANLPSEFTVQMRYGSLKKTLSKIIDNSPEFSTVDKKNITVDIRKQKIESVTEFTNLIKNKDPNKIFDNSQKVSTFNETVVGMSNDSEKLEFLKQSRDRESTSRTGGDDLQKTLGKIIDNSPKVSKSNAAKITDNQAEQKSKTSKVSAESTSRVKDDNSKKSLSQIIENSQKISPLDQRKINKLDSIKESSELISRVRTKRENPFKILSKIIVNTPNVSSSDNFDLHFESMKESTDLTRSNSPNPIIDKTSNTNNLKESSSKQ